MNCQGNIVSLVLDFFQVIPILLLSIATVSETVRLGRGGLRLVKAQPVSSFLSYSILSNNQSCMYQLKH